MRRTILAALSLALLSVDRAGENGADRYPQNPDPRQGTGGVRSLRG
jgi:hypothetical protein